MPLASKFFLKRIYAIALWHFHFYGYDDSRDDLRMAIEILEDLANPTVWKTDFETATDVGRILWRVRNEQLDWCIHDLTPATFQAYRHS